MIDPRVAASFGRQGMMRTIGAVLEEAGNGHCRITAPIGAAVSQQHGYAHAGMAFTIGDSAAGYAALSVMDPQAEVLTAEMKINLLAPAKGDRLVAVGRVIKAGRRIVVVGAEVRVGDVLVALLQGTMVPVRPD